MAPDDTSLLRDQKRKHRSARRVHPQKLQLHHPPPPIDLAADLRRLLVSLSVLGDVLGVTFFLDVSCDMRRHSGKPVRHGPGDT